MEVLFLSNTMSSASHIKLSRERTVQRIEPSQKFFNYFIKGITKNDVNLTCISIKPIYYKIYKKLFIKTEDELISNKLNYRYIGFLNYPFLKQVSIFINVAKYVRKWIKKTKNKKRVIIVDPMLVEVTRRVVRLAKLHKIKIVSFVTDVPSLTFSTTGKFAFFKKIYLKISDNDLSKFDAHMLLSKQMNYLLNKDNKPNIVVESFVNNEPIFSNEIRYKKFIIMYAGKLHQIFGIKNLVDSMEFLANDDVEMWIYGDGDATDYIINKSKKDKRIKYKGVVATNIIEKEISKVSLLVNPRPTCADFTKYSFPSKTVEYMLSATPFASTKLPGIPNEYFEYIIPIENENAEGISEVILDVINEDYETLKDKANQGQDFVLKHKNYITQGKKIYDFLEKL